MAFQTGEDPNGKPVTIKCTIEGFPRVVIESGGGGGGDASAAHQLTAISRLDTLITDLGTRVSEITGQDILLATQDVYSAVVALGNGATLFDLFARLGDIDSRLTADALVQVDIASDTQLSRLSLQSMAPDIEEIRSDAEDTRIALESINSKTPALGATDTQATLAITGKLLKSGVGAALQIQFRNTSGVAIWIQVHDRTTAPTLGARAAWYPAASTNNNQNGAVAFGHTVIGVPCQTGVYLVASSTQETYTAIASNSITYNVVYR